MENAKERLKTEAKEFIISKSLTTNTINTVSEYMKPVHLLKLLEITPFLPDAYIKTAIKLSDNLVDELELEGINYGLIALLMLENRMILKNDQRYWKRLNISAPFYFGNADKLSTVIELYEKSYLNIENIIITHRDPKMLIESEMPIAIQDTKKHLKKFKKVKIEGKVFIDLMFKRLIQEKIIIEKAIEYMGLFKDNKVVQLSNHKALIRKKTSPILMKYLKAIFSEISHNELACIASRINYISGFMPDKTKPYSTFEMNYYRSTFNNDIN